jgi:hypothetical protein
MPFDSLLSTLESELRAILDTCVTGMVATARTQLETALGEVVKERAKGLAEVARERAELHREIEAMQTHKEAQEGRVELNIGGRRFETSVQTLRRVPHTFFDAYFSGRYAQDVCADGSIFVDRDGEHFGHVLEYMRDGVVSVAAQDASELDIGLLRALKREFAFYCIELMADPEDVAFVVGGHGGDDLPTSLVERYDNASGKWTQGAPMMTTRACFGLCEVGGVLYATGGFDADDPRLASVECYNPALDAWSNATALSRSRVGHYACAVGDTMYVVGGHDDEGRQRSVLKFDVDTQAWSEVARMPSALSHCSACVLGNDIFVFGGFDGEWLADSTFCYNTLTNVWTTLAPMPEAKNNHSVCVMSGLIYVVGGMAGRQESDIVSSVHKYDPAANLWSTVAPLLSPRVGLASFVLDGRLYAAGGSSGVHDLSSVERYNAASDSWEKVRGMELSGPRVDFCAQGMRLEVGLFDSLETKARRARNL